MAVNRRTFLGGLAAGAVAAPAVVRAAMQTGGRRIEKIGLQLYTVRDEMQKDFEGTIAKVAAIGYRELEFAGYFNQSPANVRAILDRHGLTSPSTHVDYASLDADKWSAVVEASHTIGHAFIVMPWFDDATRAQPDIWKKAAEKFNRAAAVSKKAGIQFAYHNHNFEFAGVDGKRPYDVLLAECDPSLVKFEMDLCWITAAGQDPLAYFHKYPGRFPMVHAKDSEALARRHPHPARRPRRSTSCCQASQTWAAASSTGSGFSPNRARRASSTILSSTISPRRRLRASRTATRTCRRCASDPIRAGTGCP